MQILADCRGKVISQYRFYTPRSALLIIQAIERMEFFFMRAARRNDGGAHCANKVRAREFCQATFKDMLTRASVGADIKFEGITFTFFAPAAEFAYVKRSQKVWVYYSKKFDANKKAAREHARPPVLLLRAVLLLVNEYKPRAHTQHQAKLLPPANSSLLSLRCVFARLRAPPEPKTSYAFLPPAPQGFVKVLAKSFAVDIA